MTRETKVGLLVGMAVIMLIAILVNDFLAEVKRPANDMVRFPDQASDLDHSGYQPPSLAGDGARERGPYPAQAFERQPQRRQQGVYLPQQPIPAPTQQRPPVEQRRRDDRERIDTNKYHYPDRAVALHKEPSEPELTLDDVLERMPRRAAEERPNILRAQRTDRAAARNDNRLPILPSAESIRRDRTAELPTPHREQRPPTAQRESPRPPVNEKTWHTVESGESLYHVAKEYYGDGERWRDIAAANPTRVQENGGVKAGVRLIIPDAVVAGNGGGRREPDRRRNTDGRMVTVRTPEQLEVALRDQNAPPARTSGVEITVRKNQSLSELARIHLGKESLWPQLRDANRDRLRNGQTVYEGMKLRLPALTNERTPRGGRNTAQALGTNSRFVSAAAQTNQKTYIVQPGDNLSTIAGKTLGNRNKYMAIFNANKDRLEDENDITAGQELIIPVGNVN